MVGSSEEVIMHSLRVRWHVVALLLLAATLVISAQTKSLRLVSTAWPPFTNVEGQPRFALELVEAGLKRIGLTATTTIVEASQYTPAVLTGPYDGSAAAWRDPEREGALLFSQPYLENRLILVARRGSNVSAANLAALTGRRVAIVEGYAYGAEVDNAGPTYVRSRSDDDSLRMLLDSGVEYALMDDLVVQYLVSAYPQESRTRLQIGATPLVTRPLHMAIRRSLPDAQSIVDRFNAQLRAMISDHTYHRLLHVQWIRADIDGDGIPEYVAESDKAGKTQPKNAYDLFSPKALSEQVSKERERYFFGGAVYNGWSSVPDRYKVDDLGRPDAVHPTARIFTFSWK
jgi:polar amino acid transport system substrate-binding protein